MKRTSIKRQLCERIKAEVKDKGECMSIDELSKYIHYTKSYIRQLTKRGEIPFHKPLGKLLFYKNEIDAWITAKAR